MKLGSSLLVSVLGLLVLVGGLAPVNARAAESGSLSETGLGRDFTSETTNVNGLTLHYVRGGSGPALILIHGFPQDWFEYHAIMPRLAKQFTVIAVDLRGIGGSSATPGSYDAASMAQDVYQLAASLRLQRVYVVGHDIGGMVTYAFVRRFPQMARGAMILDAPLPGLEGWNEVEHDPTMWHAHFMQVPELPEKLIGGRQAEFFDYFFHFGKFTPAEVAHFVKAYAAPEQLHAVLEMYRALPANAKFNAAQGSRNEVPLFIGVGEKSPFAKLLQSMVNGLRASGFTHVESGVIRGAVHYVVADQPEAVAELIEHHAASRAE
jgi:pimeloyl-ACP methyl ester carboxylesterase